MSHTAIRTCLGCRQRTARHELLRVVATDTGSGPQAVPDPTRRRPGRGAHLHPTTECLSSALRRRAFARALRAPGGLDCGPVEQYVEALTGHRPG